MFFLLLTLFAAPANLPRVVAVRLPSPAALIEAGRGRDEVELERVARRLGPARLRRIALSGKRQERLVAVRALPLVDGAWAELATVVALLGDPDGEVADTAAHALVRIAEGLSPEKSYADEIPSDVTRDATHRMLEAAGQVGLRPVLRAAAIEAASTLARRERPVAQVAPELVALVGDGEPAVRRAAIEALDARASMALLVTALGDVDRSVAAAAGASLCADVASVKARHPAPALAVAWSDPARARVRELVLEAELPIADRLDLIPCLRAFATVDDQKLLDKLARSRSDPLKRRAKLFGGR